MNTIKNYNFKSETSKILDIMINSLYSNKEIFLRELISNASDALNKLRVEYIYQNSSFSNDSIKELSINILTDTENGLLTIRDNGIGLKYEEAIKQLGIVAKSGTKEYLQRIKKNSLKDNTLIGNFGVGFYSCFIVANKVTVFSRSPFVKETEGILWESEGKKNFEISYKNKTSIGTDVTIHLKNNEKKFLEENYLKDLIKKYSNFIKFPIYLNIFNKVNNTYSVQKINEETIFWQKNKNEIQDIEYKEFYKKISDNLNEPLSWVHHKVEGKLNYTILVYLPEINKDKLSIYENIEKIQKPKIKLYIKNIFVNDNIDHILPNYLKFIEGIVDAEDLPLNVSREILQDSKNLKIIKTNLVKKIISMLENISVKQPIIYTTFWKQLGCFLKEGIIEDKVNQERLISLLRFKSSKSGENLISLEDYIKNMTLLQKKIFFISGINSNIIQNNPNLEIFVKNNIEVLYFYDRIDEWIINYINNYKGKKFQSLSTLDEQVIMEELKLNKNFDKTKIFELKQLKEKIQNNFIKNNILNIQNIEFSNLLINYASSLVISNENNLTTNMSKLLSETGHDTQPLKYILRLNVNHPIIKYLINNNNRLNTNDLNEWITLLFEQALLTEQGYLEKYNDFINRINKLLTFNLITC